MCCCVDLYFVFGEEVVQCDCLFVDIDVDYVGLYWFYCIVQFVQFVVQVCGVGVVVGQVCYLVVEGVQFGSC